MDFPINAQIHREHGEPISASKYTQPIAEDCTSDSEYVPSESEYAPSNYSTPSRDRGFNFRSVTARNHHKDTPDAPSRDSQNLFDYPITSPPEPPIINSTPFENSQNHFHNPIASNYEETPNPPIVNSTWAIGLDGEPFIMRQQYLNTEAMPGPEGVFCCEMDEVTFHDEDGKAVEDFLEWDKEERHRAGWIESIKPEIMYPVEQLITIVEDEYANPGGKKKFRYFVRSSSGTNRWMEVSLEWYEAKKHRYGNPCACITHNCLVHQQYFTVLLRERIESPGHGARD